MLPPAVAVVFRDKESSRSSIDDRIYVVIFAIMYYMLFFSMIGFQKPRFQAEWY